MTLEQLAIEIPIVVAFAAFALQLIKLNNKQTDAFIEQLTKFQTAFFAQLELQSKIFDARNDALIQALRSMQTANTANDKALVQSLSCLVKQIEFISAILQKHEILPTPDEISTYKGFMTPNRKVRTHASKAPDQVT